KPFQIDIEIRQSLPRIKSRGALELFSSRHEVAQSLIGHLVVNGGRIVKSRPLRLNPPTPSYFAACSIWFGLIISAIIVVISAAPFIKRLNDKLGLPEWSSSASWATNLTALGSLLTLVLSNTALPGLTRNLQRGEYNTLGIIFTL